MTLGYVAAREFMSTPMSRWQGRHKAKQSLFLLPLSPSPTVALDPDLGGAGQEEGQAVIIEIIEK